jgi:hypothetical protein
MVQGGLQVEKNLPRPLDAEIVDEAGHWARVRLVAYLGEARWRATREDGQEIIVEASQIFTLARGRAA